MSLNLLAIPLGAKRHSVFFPWGWKTLLLVLAGLTGWMIALFCLTSVAQAQNFLSPAQAFQVTAAPLPASGSPELQIRFQVADGYYLYRERFKFDAVGVNWKNVELPKGQVHWDENFQKNLETYHQPVMVRLTPFNAPETFNLEVTYQGCAKAGLCYPPKKAHFAVSWSSSKQVFTKIETVESDDKKKTADASVLNASESVDAGESSWLSISAALSSGYGWRVVLVFIAAGLLLSLTPCVLPMLPILSSMIMGSASQQAQNHKKRSLMLATAYSLGMILIYTLLGIAAGWIGQGLAIQLQQPVTLAGFAVLLVLLSLSMFGLYELQLPSFLRDKLGQTQAQGGHWGGAFIMGGLSALMVSPCVAAPLAAALLYISQSRDIWLGGLALSSLALGMCVPLLILGGSAGRWMPRPGPWMESIKQVFGFLLVGLALWMIQSLLSFAVSSLLWAAWLLLMAGFSIYRAFKAKSLQGRVFASVAGVILAVLGTWQAAGTVLALQGRSILGRPLSALNPNLDAQHDSLKSLNIITIRSLDEFKAELAASDRPVMLDFYADWCVSCKEMDALTFSDPRVQDRLKFFRLLRADVTKNSAQDAELLEHFGLFGPPGIVFFDQGRQEVHKARLIGYENSEHFLKRLQNLQGVKSLQ